MCDGRLCVTPPAPRRHGRYNAQKRQVDPLSLELGNTGGGDTVGACLTWQTWQTRQTRQAAKTSGTSETSGTSPPARDSLPSAPPDADLRGDTQGLLTVSDESSEGVRDIMGRLKLASVDRDSLAAIDRDSLMARHSPQKVRTYSDVPNL